MIWCVSSQTASDMMPKRDHERDLELDKKIEALRRKNEALMKRYKVRTSACRQSGIWLLSGLVIHDVWGMSLSFESLELLHASWLALCFPWVACRRWRRTRKGQKRTEWLCRAARAKLMTLVSQSASPPVWVSTMWGNLYFNVYQQTNKQPKVLSVLLIAHTVFFLIKWCYKLYEYFITSSFLWSRTVEWWWLSHSAVVHQLGKDSRRLGLTKGERVLHQALAEATRSSWWSPWLAKR